MLIVNIVVLVMLAALFIFSIRYPREWLEQIDQREHKLYFLYPLADLLLTKLKFKRFLRSAAKVEDIMKALYVTNKAELYQRLYWCSKISAVYMILALCSLLSLCLQLAAGEKSPLREGRYLLRPDHGEGSTQVALELSWKEVSKEGQKGEKAFKEQEVSIHIPERQYSKEELPKVFARAEDYLGQIVLGSNQSADMITERLNFCTLVPGTGITVSWRPEDIKLIHSDGTIDNTAIEQARRTNVTAILSYLDQKHERVMSFTILPKEYTEEELFHKELEHTIKEVSERTAEQEQLELPTSMGKYFLLWNSKEDPIGLQVMAFGILLCVLIWLLVDKELDKRMEKRKEQLLLDYPELINKFTLLINAGMTVKQSWDKIAEEYCNRLRSTNKRPNKRYAYEELLTTVHELKLGLSESTAYEQYGRRIGLIPYIKFCSLINQNLRKGNKGFTDMLRKEAVDAFEMRKAMTRRLGEEAGTKLLFPMLLMLILVFSIVLIPSFLTFQIS